MKIKLLILSLAISGIATAQYTRIFDFSGGSNPNGSLISEGSFLYGVTERGGSVDNGTIFKIKPDGTECSKLFHFSGPSTGSYPRGPLVSDGTFLYGMTFAGGANNYGVIYKIKPDGSGYSKLLDFAGATNGSRPQGSLFYDGTYLFGMTSEGGLHTMGVLFKIKPDGSGYTKLFDFSTPDGKSPIGSLLSDGTSFYGITWAGGASDIGVVFTIKPDGSGYTKLLDFTGTNGGYPSGSLISDGSFLYGMTHGGGANGYGTVYKIKPDGSGYSKLLDFDRYTSGMNPSGSLIYDGTFLYGMTWGGGNSTYEDGVLFKIKTDGSGYLKLLDFTGINGSNPTGSLISDGAFLYGMTWDGGSHDDGVIFRIKPDGTAYSNLQNIFYASYGDNPEDDLISDGTFLYGMTYRGGTHDLGVLFKIKPDGTGHSKLIDFAGAANGSHPWGSLISDGTFLYGMTSEGGVNNVGTLFKIKPDGTGYSKLVDFAHAVNGSYPQGSLLFDGTFLYGMTQSGGTIGNGVIFKIKPDGTGYSKLLDFDFATNGSTPLGNLISDGTYLYGMTRGGGANNLGVIFKIKPDGTGYFKLLDFAGTANGSHPLGSLISDGTFLYGMTREGGLNDYGTLFRIKTDGTNYSNLLDFSSANGMRPQGSLIADGANFYGMTSEGGVNNGGVIFKIMSDGTGYAKLRDLSPVDGTSPKGSLISDGTFLYGMTGGSFSGIFKLELLVNGITENNPDTSFTAYPNPFSSSTTLSVEIPSEPSSLTLKNATLTVYNFCGQPVKELKNISGNSITFHRGNLPTGLYFFLLQQDNTTIITEKILITN